MVDPHHHYIPLYCNQSTQTQPDNESDYESDYEWSSDSEFPPIRIGKGTMSFADAMRYNKDEPPQSCHRQQHNSGVIGLGQTNILNVVDGSAPMQHGLGKVTNH